MYMWKTEKRDAYLLQILAQKAPVIQHFCAGCSAVRGVNWKCTTCLGEHRFCRTCMKNRHDHLPFHKIQRWNGRYFQRAELWEVGVQIHLGHCGDACPTNQWGWNQTEDRPNIAKGEQWAAADRKILRNQKAAAANRHLGDMAAVAAAVGETEAAVLHELDTAVKRYKGEREGDWMEIYPLLRKIAMHLNKPSLEVWDILQDMPRPGGSTAEADIDMDSTPAADDAEEEVRAAMAEEELLDDPLENDDAHSEEDHESTGGFFPNIYPKVPTEDFEGNPFVTVVDVSGIHRIPLVSCSCPSNTKDKDIQLLDLSLYPSSYDKIRTLFTFAVLDDFRLENLECKTSAYQYYQKLRRQTCAAFPHLVPNRYPELRRVSRQWRNLKIRKWFGFIGKRYQPERGAFALFCAACPQPGINLAQDYHTAYPE